MQPPPVQRLIIGAQLETVGFPFEVVGKEQRNDGRRRRTQTPDVIVLVVKTRDGSGDPGPELGAVTQFVSNHRFGNEGRRASQNNGRRGRFANVPVNA